MKTATLFAVVLLFNSGVGVCRANLGDTEAQCIARYGAEVDVTTDVGYRQVGDKAASFTVKTASGSLDVRVTFLNGMSCHESINNTDSSHGLTEAQMKAILDAQSPTLKWRKRKTVYRSDQEAEETYESESWLRSDGAIAIFSLSGKASTGDLAGALELSTKQYADAQLIYDKENGD